MTEYYLHKIKDNTWVAGNSKVLDECTRFICLRHISAHKLEITIPRGDILICDNPSMDIRIERL